MVRPPVNIGASVRARLLNHAQRTGQVFERVLIRFALERLLYRLGISESADRFVLKGAMLLTTWLPHTNRGTRDLDLLGFGDSSAERIVGIFQQILALPADDGIIFDRDGLSSEPIREAVEYGGLRLRTTATLAGAVIPVVIDIGFGDAVEPGLHDLDYPVLLDFPAPRVRAYAPETVVAEKLQAMVALGRANTRMKDFYDLWALFRLFAFDDGRLAAAITATLERRGTPAPADIPDALTDAFGEHPDKQRQWTAFANGIEDAPASLRDVITELRRLAWPHLQAAQRRPG